MKHYLDLIPIAEGRHRKQSRMTRACIVLAVFLVTVIFGMADMEMRSQLIQATKSDGGWHAGFQLDEEQGALLKARPEIASAAQYGSLNYHLEDHYQIENEETVICGFEPEFLEMFPEAEIFEGAFPRTATDAALNETAKNRLGIEVGDQISLTTPLGKTVRYRITGFTRDTALLAEHDAFGMFLNMEGFSALDSERIGGAQEKVCFVTFRPFCNISKAINEISSQFGLEQDQVRQNVKVLALMFQSRDSYMMRFYFVAAVLALLVVIAGILMITASMNSSVARRTEFFGMMSCLGADRKQIIRFVRREALNWCRRAVPLGLISGTAVVWILCAMLRFLSPGLFEDLPVFGISVLSIIAGIVVGFFTVILAAGAPARRAAQVSPLTAVSGNAGTIPPVSSGKGISALCRPGNFPGIFKVETLLGIHHASGSKKNYVLVTGSFAFSIILFLAFSTAIDFMHHAITPLRPSAPDISASSKESSCSIPPELTEIIQKRPEVKRAFGRSCARVTAEINGRNEELTILSYDEQQFQWSQDSLIEGALTGTAAESGALAVFRKNSGLALGTSVTIQTGSRSQKVPVTGILGDVPYSYGTDKKTGSGEDMIICSEDLFRRLFNEDRYAVLDIQLHASAEDSDVQEIRETIRQMCKDDISFSDKRIGNREAKGASYSMALFLYGFLAVIALIAFFNIINCISMSVSARMDQYGAMRAIGMSLGQLTRMVIGEVLTYTVSGVFMGCLVGFPINMILFRSLVTARWGDVWTLPLWELMVILFIMLVSVCLAVMGPARQIQRMSITDTIRNY